MSFHAQDGFFFERLPHGEVEVTVTDGKAPAEDSSNVLKRTLIAPNNWASVVASMGSSGESRETFDRALEFHG